MHICVHAYMHVCIYAYMHICMHICMHACIYACMDVCTYAFFIFCFFNLKSIFSRFSRTGLSLPPSRRSRRELSNGGILVPNGRLRADLWPETCLHGMHACMHACESAPSLSDQRRTGAQSASRSHTSD